MPNEKLSQKEILKREASRWIQNNPFELKVLVSMAVKAYCKQKQAGQDKNDGRIRHNVPRDIGIARNLNQQVQGGNVNALLNFATGQNKERTFMGVSRGASLAKYSLMHFFSDALYKKLTKNERVKALLPNMRFDMIEGNAAIRDTSTGYNPFAPIDRSHDVTLQELWQPGLTALNANNPNALLEAQPKPSPPQPQAAETPTAKTTRKKNLKTVSWGNAQVRVESKGREYKNQSDLDERNKGKKSSDEDYLFPTDLDPSNEEQREFDEKTETKPSSLATQAGQDELKATLEGIRQAQHENPALDRKRPCNRGSSPRS